MYMRLTFNVSGDFFNAVQALKNVSSDKIYFTFDEQYPNYIQFNSNKDFSNEYYDEEYESVFFEFIYKNIENFIKNGADDFSLFMEVYISEDEQCNFEVLNSEFLSLIGKYKISIPFSVYKVRD
ncbi:hypothetical protein IC798_06455 [Acinetobacter seifertii]|uniref:hypothetical protein n=1 Tax=Acinetobacter seifertii TaxID=1530123 RepID=UPI00168CD508|nr:hypothetical protein [Acinetobacter seifertii]QNX02951.1 hypothetical protein IC798_06455 [Acinetobacter seifertii]